MKLNKRFLKNDKGFTLLEIIVMFAMLVVLSSCVVLYMGHLRDVNVKHAAKQVDMSLDKLQVRTMSKAQTPYLYIYKLDDGCYMKVLNKEITSFDYSEFDNTGTRLGSSSIKIYKERSGIKEEISGTKFVTLNYNKSAQFNTDISSVIFKRDSEYKIKLIKDTGRHIME